LGDLPDQYRTCIYRIVQETLTNCVRHAQASRVDVTLVREGDRLELRVADDGVGFGPERRDGLGLLGIEERVREPLLETQPGISVIAEAADGQDALRLCEEHRPDVLILDIGMPKLNGIEVAMRVQKLPRPPQVIMLSMHADESYVLRSLDAGARAYLLKDATDEDLLPAVRAVTSGKCFFSPVIASMLAEDYVRLLQERGLDDSYHLLTDREKEVLQLLAEGHANKDVAAVLRVGLSTVETHRANFMQKLGLHNTAEIVLYAVRKRLVV
jgi:DNA-binding NarL/FixJ family response regulator